MGWLDSSSSYSSFSFIPQLIFRNISGIRVRWVKRNRAMKVFFHSTVMFWYGYFLCGCSKCQFRGWGREEMSICSFLEWFCDFFRHNFHHWGSLAYRILIYAVPPPTSLVATGFLWPIPLLCSVFLGGVPFKTTQYNFLLWALIDSWEIQALFITPEARSCGGFQRSHFPSLCSK